MVHARGHPIKPPQQHPNQRDLSAGTWMFALLLALPGLFFLTVFMTGNTDAETLLHPTGETSARLLILTLLISPLRVILPNAAWLRWLRGRRRALGLAAFAYAAAHGLLYVLDMASLQLMLDELGAVGIWTGWLALALLVPLALTSTQLAVKRLGQRWHKLHRLVYLAASLTLIHWLYVHNNIAPALAHFLPLTLLVGFRLWRRRRPSEPHV